MLLLNNCRTDRPDPYFFRTFSTNRDDFFFAQGTSKQTTIQSRHTTFPLLLSFSFVNYFRLPSIYTSLYIDIHIEYTYINCVTPTSPTLPRVRLTPSLPPYILSFSTLTFTQPFHRTHACVHISRFTRTRHFIRYTTCTYIALLVRLLLSFSPALSLSLSLSRGKMQFSHCTQFRDSSPCL